MCPTSGSDAIDLIQLIAALIELAAGGGDLDGAVVGNVDLGAGLLHDLADDLAARADDLADLVDRDREHFDARRMLAELGACLRERLAHLAEDVQAAVLRLRKRDPHDLFGDAGDLDVHLQRGHAALGAGHLEIHVAEMVFVAENVGKDGEPLLFLDQAHGDAGGRPLERNARIHQRQRGAANRRHRGRAVRTR